ncbi:hypothetical protein D0B54_21470 [Solimonas sp. K1W22B-7]|uniref:hypothetical protein n=1 Tax=Solimonas sp. K1W22B-7 TaxID=2303331 RepID=UPI000E32FA44|nr:hypothetical protein [Solimonas sp. K1W22B-7]AXQ31089.1 hypothetical protein D0B54_21470 [Solimonas sp. K1W22B-7]
MTLTQISLAAFVAVASGGLLLASLIALKKRIPAFLATAHGLGGLAALALLFTAALRGQEATPALTWWALVVLLSGFVGGMLLFRVVFRHRATLPLAALHGGIGAVGIYLLYRVAI